MKIEVILFFMILTTKSRYAVMAIVEVANNNSVSPIKLADISLNQDIPLSYLEQIFLKLKKANIVNSVKGPGGGYLLNHPASKITVEHIIDAVDERLKMTRCSKEALCGKNKTKCLTHDLWKGLSLNIREYLSKISIDDIVSKSLVI